MKPRDFHKRSLALALTLTLAGCGSSSPTGTTSKSAAVIPIPLVSSAVIKERLPATYTCDGKDTWPPLKWGFLPAGTSEVALFLLQLAPNKNKLTSIDWVMGGISAAVHSLTPGVIPHGAFLISTSTGKRRYSACPAKGQSAQYRFSLYAVPPKVKVTAEIGAVELLGNLTQGPEGYRATGYGSFPASYRRP